MYWGYTITAYAFTFGVLAAYTLWVLRRGKSLSRQVPADKRRFHD